jgi:hypothetical protein
MSAWARSFRDEAMRTPVVLTCAAMAFGGIGAGVVGGASAAAVAYGVAGLLGLIPTLMVFSRHRVKLLRE